MREKKYHDYSSARRMRQLKISWVNLALIYHPKGNNITNIPYISTNFKGRTPMLIKLRIFTGIILTMLELKAQSRLTSS